MLGRLISQKLYFSGGPAMSSYIGNRIVKKNLPCETQIHRAIVAVFVILFDICFGQTLEGF